VTLLFTFSKFIAFKILIINIFKNSKNTNNFNNNENGNSNMNMNMLTMALGKSLEEKIEVNPNMKNCILRWICETDSDSQM